LPQAQLRSEIIAFQTVAAFRSATSRSRAFPSAAGDEGRRADEIGDAAGLAAGARGKHVGAGLAEMRESVVAPEEVDHFDGVGFPGIVSSSAARKTSTARWIWMTSISFPAVEVQRIS
jgi:hypothetical protein